MTEPDDTDPTQPAVRMTLAEIPATVTRTGCEPALDKMGTAGPGRRPIRLCRSRAVDGRPEAATPW